MQTALHFTASKNNLDIARKLMAHKATPRKKDKRQQLALHRAAAIGSVPMLKLLLDNQSPVNATDIDGMTALHHGEFCQARELKEAHCPPNPACWVSSLALLNVLNRLICFLPPSIRS